MKTKLIAVIAAALFLAAACKKENDKSVRENLTNKSWRITKGGFDANANSIPDGNEIKPADSTLLATGNLNDNGTGSVQFTINDTSGIAPFTWTLDASNTYINISVPILNSNTVSKILTLNDNSLSVIVDTSAGVKLFAYFEKQ